MAEAPRFLVDVVPITAENQFEVMGRTDPHYKELMLKEPAGGRKFKDFFSYVQDGAEAVFLINPTNGEDMAVVIERIAAIDYEGENLKVLARYLRVVDRKYQNQQLGPVLTNEPIQRHKDIKYITARTFNPFVFRVEEQSPYIGDTITPIHNKLYDSRTRGILIATFGENSIEIQESDPETGLCEGVYPEREPEIFDLKLASSRVHTIWARMLDLGFNYARRDGIRYLAEVNPPRGRNIFEYMYLEDYKDSGLILPANNPTSRLPELDY